MKNEFIPYEEALALKELGFDEDCFGYYSTVELDYPSSPLAGGQGGYLVSKLEVGEFVTHDQYKFFDTYFGPKKFKSINAPLYQQVFRFFRDKHNLSGQIISWNLNGQLDSPPTYTFEIWDIKDSRKFTGDDLHGRNKRWDSPRHEEAELACIRKLIEIVKK